MNGRTCQMLSRIANIDLACSGYKFIVDCSIQSTIKPSPIYLFTHSSIVDFHLDLEVS